MPADCSSYKNGSPSVHFYAFHSKLNLLIKCEFPHIFRFYGIENGLVYSNLWSLHTTIPKYADLMMQIIGISLIPLAPLSDVKSSRCSCQTYTCQIELSLVFKCNATHNVSIVKTHQKEFKIV